MKTILRFATQADKNCLTVYPSSSPEKVEKAVRMDFEGTMQSEVGKAEEKRNGALKEGRMFDMPIIETSINGNEVVAKMGFETCKDCRFIKRGVKRVFSAGSACKECPQEYRVYFSRVLNNWHATALKAQSGVYHD